MRLSRSRTLRLLHNSGKRLFLRQPSIKPICDDREMVETAPPVSLNWPPEVPRPPVRLVRDVGKYPHWTKYERFLKHNGFPHAYLDIQRSDWIEEARKYDIILWRPMAGPVDLDEERRKIYVLENYLGKLCHPDFRTIMLYENKLILHEIARVLGIPMVPAFVSHSYPEVAATLGRLRYPLVSKTTAGAGSLGVELVKNVRAARRFARQVFRRAGRGTHWLYEQQKDYVYWQDFQENEGYDLRVIVVGRYVFGYFRDVPRGEFRASGMHVYRMEPPPDDAIRLAAAIHAQLGLVMLAVDMLRDPADGSLHVIEMSPFVLVDIPAQLQIDGVPGAYVLDSSGGYTFKQGRFWPQELVLQELLARYLQRPIRPHKR